MHGSVYVQYVQCMLLYMCNVFLFLYYVLVSVDVLVSVMYNAHNACLFICAMCVSVCNAHNACLFICAMCVSVCNACNACLFICAMCVSVCNAHNACLFICVMCVLCAMHTMHVYLFV